MSILRRYQWQSHPVRLLHADLSDVLRTHTTSVPHDPICSVALGRTMVGAALLAAQQSEDHRLSIHIRSGGAMGSLYAEADYSGSCRGYVSFPFPDWKQQDVDQFGDLVLPGDLQVTTSARGQLTPHVSTVPLQTGEIGDDIAHFLFQSSQVHAAVCLSVDATEGGVILSAGGFLLELLQSVPQAIVESLVLASYPSAQFHERSADEWATHFFSDHKWEELSSTPLTIQCQCSRHRFLDAIRLLGQDEVRSMMQQPSSELLCHFCGKQYVIGPEDLRELLT